MHRTRLALGFAAGAVLVASSAAHSLLGWPALRAALERTHAPAELVTGLAIGWHFAGVAMLTMGGVVLGLFAAAARGRPVPLWPARLVALAYVAFGAWALAVSGRDPFFLATFVAPGLLLGAAAWPRGAAEPARSVVRPVPLDAR